MLKRKKEIIAKVMATTMLASTLTSTFTTNVSAAEPQTKATVSETTIAGDDRYKTAVEISKNYSSTSKHAVIVNGQKGIVDALTATPYASLKKAPILMTQSTKLNADTKKELTRRGVKTVDIVGGVNSVSDAVKAEIEAMGITVNRIAGNSKYETSLEVAKRIDAISDVSKIAVANGEVLADAVSVAAPAAQNKMPIILAHPTNGLDAKTKAFIDGELISNSYVIGGTSSVSTATQNSLPGTKERLAGTGRQETNAAVVKKFYTSSSYDNIYVAKSGQVVKADEIADALAAGVLAASNQDPVILVGKTLANDQKTLLEGKKFTKITKVGGEIPTASIDAIKATQNDPEAIVSGVTLVNYKTIKITGKELNRIDKSKVSISGNTTSSYTANSAGTEATVEFANAFSNGTNTVKVTSNLGNVTSHTFTYNSQISSVEAITSEIGTGANGAIQYLEFTVNGGQKRTVEELKALGWKVEFKSSSDIFYSSATLNSNTSLDGKLRTKNADNGSTPFVKDQVYDYEVVLTKGSEKIKSGLKAFRVVDKSVQYKEIKSFDIKLNNDVKIKSNKLVVGETADLINLEVVDANNNTAKLDNADNFTVTSSNPAVVSVNSVSDKNKLNANSTGTAEITIKGGTATKKFTVSVVSDARKVSTVSLSKSTIYLSSNQTGEIEATVKDQYGDLFKGYNLIEKDEVIKTSDKSGNEDVATVKKTTQTKEDGKIKITINAADKEKNVNGSLTIKDNDKKIATITVYVQAKKEPTSWKLENEVGKDNILDLYTPTGKEDDNTLELTLNGYNGSYLVGKITDEIKIHTSGTISKEDEYVVTSTNSKVAEITEAKDGKIIVKAIKDGSATIRLYKNGSEKSSFSVTVKDSTPKITAISTKSIDTIEKPNNSFDVIESLLNVTEVSKDKTVVSGLTISGTTEEVLMGSDAKERIVLYVEKDNENGYDKDKDLLLATVDVTTDFGATITSGKKVNIEDNKSGNIIVKIFRGKHPEDTSNPSNPFKVELIKVNTSN